MVFNYVPSGYHGSSISSVWQCNSLCPAAMSAKLRQFTCSCSYIALRKNKLPCILCIHLISGTHSLPLQHSCQRQNKVKGVCVFSFFQFSIWQPNTNAFECHICTEWKYFILVQSSKVMGTLNIYGVQVLGCINFQTLFNPGVQKEIWCN